MALRNPGDMNRLVRECNGNREEIVQYLELEIEADPEAVLRLADRVQPYLTVEVIRTAMERVMATDHPESYLPYLKSVQNFFPDEDLRTRMIGVHHSHPWMFYTHGRSLRELFPNEYFRRLVDEGLDIFKNEDLLRIFQLYNAQMAIVSFNEKMQRHMRSLLDTEEQADVYIEQSKEAGFACGGMEKNYLQAAREGRGLCTVNGGQLLAKHFHAKGADKAKKVSYVAPKTQETMEGYMLWKDYLYAPTDGQHTAVISALEAGERDVTIPHLTVKPIRPMIGATSAQIFALFRGETAPS